MNELYKISWALICYSTSYALVILLPLMLGVEFYGKFTIVKFQFDLLVAVFMFGASQAYFRISRILTLQIIESCNFSIMTILVFIILFFKYSLDLDIAQFTIVSAGLYSIIQIWRLRFLKCDQVKIYQGINAIFPVIIIFQALILALLDISIKPEIMVLLSSALSVVFVLLVRLKVREAVKIAPFPNFMTLKLYLRNTSSGAMMHTAQFLLPVGITYIFTKSHYPIESIGEFGIAWGVYMLVLAPSIMFGGNVIEFLENNDGRSPAFLQIRILVLLLGVVILIYGVIVWLFVIGNLNIQKHSTISLLAIQVIIMSGIRCSIPILLWRGKISSLFIIELSRLFLGLIIAYAMSPRSLIEYAVFLLTIEVFTCILVFVSIRGKKENDAIF